MRFVLYLFLLAGTLTAQTPELIVPTNHTEPIHGMAVSEDGRYLATSAGTQVKIWEYRTGRLVKDFIFPGVSAFTADKEYVAFSKDGRYLIALSDEKLHLIDLQTFTVVDEQQLFTVKIAVLGRKSHTGPVAVHPDGERFHFERRVEGVTSLEEYRIADRRLSTVATFEVMGELQRAARRITYSPSGALALITFTTTTANKIVHLGTKVVSDFPYGEAYLPNGNLLGQARDKGATTLRVSKPDGTVLWTKKIVSDDLQPWGKEYTNFTVDSNTEIFYYGIDGGGMISGNYATGADVDYRPKPGGAKGGSLLMGNGGRLLVTTLNPSQVLLSNPGSGTTERIFGSNSLAVSRFMTDPISRRFAVTSRERSIRVYEMTVRGPKLLYLTEAPDFVDIALSQGGRFLATVDPKSGSARVHDVAAGTSREVTFPFGKPFLAAVSADGAAGFISASGLAFYPPGATSPSWSKALVYDASNELSLYHWIALSPDGETLVATGRATDPKDADKTVSNVIGFRTSNGKEIWRRAESYGDYHFTEDGTVVVGGDYNEIVRFEAKSGKESDLFNTRGPTLLGAAVSADGRYITATKEGDPGKTIEVFEIGSRKIVQQFSGHINTIIGNGFIADDFHMSAGFDNTIRLWDQRSGKELAKLVLFENERDWVVIAPDGRFDATEGALKLLHYRLGDQLVPLEQLYESFYTPGLLGQCLSRQPAPRVTPIKVSEVVRPPSVKITYKSGARNLIVEDDDVDIQTISAPSRDAELVVEGSGNGSAITELRLYHNGKLISGTARGLIVEEDVPAGNNRTYTVQLVEGDNDFRAVAINAQRTESAPALLRLTYTAPAAAPEKSGTTLHLITIGINSYKNSRYNLNYAVADAAGIDEAIALGLAGIVDDTKHYAIRDEGATRADILAALEDVKRQTKPEDLLIFYYAGHGVMSESGSRDFYIVPHDVTQLYGNDEGLAARGISATELKNIAAAIPARKQLYLLDACQSAGAVESIVQRGAAEEKAIAQLARSTGTHWLTASGSQQFASEFDELGHGAFTFVILEALQGKAAGDDTRVTVNELKAYLDRVVPEVTELKTGTAQYPASFGYGQDFPVSVRR